MKHWGFRHQLLKFCLDHKVCGTYGQPPGINFLTPFPYPHCPCVVYNFLAGGAVSTVGAAALLIGTSLVSAH